MYDGLPGAKDPDFRYRVSLMKPTLIIGAGIAGAGKSTLFRPLVKAINDCAYLDKDTISHSFMWRPRKGERRDMTRYVPEEIIPLVYNDPNGNYYGNHVCLQTYHLLLMMARQMLALGKHPLLDGNYIKEIRWGYIENVLQPQLKDIGYSLKIVLVHAPADLIRQRLIKRAFEHDKFKLSSDVEWAKLIEEQPPVPPEIEKYPHIKVDTTEPMSKDRFAAVLDFLRT